MPNEAYFSSTQKKCGRLYLNEDFKRNIKQDKLKGRKKNNEMSPEEYIDSDLKIKSDICKEKQEKKKQQKSLLER